MIFIFNSEFALAKPCEKEVLAKSHVCIVERCSCGSLHLTIGPVTLRLDGGTLDDVAKALGEAAAKQQRQAELHHQTQRGDDYEMPC